MQTITVLLSEMLCLCLHISGTISAQHFLRRGDTGHVNTELQQLIFQHFFAEANNVPSELRKSFIWDTFVCFANKGNGLVFHPQYLCFMSQKNVI